MNKGTIIYIGGFELPDKNAAAHRVLGNAKVLHEIGYRIVFIGVDKDLPFNDDILSTQNEFQGFTYYSVAYPKSKFDWIDYLTSIKSFIKIWNLYDDIVSVICYNYQALALKKMIIFCRNKRIKIIGDCTEWYSARGNGLIFFLFKGFDTFYRMRILHKKLDGLIVISNYLFRYYKKCRNVINVPPLVDLKEEKWNNINIEDNQITTLVYAGSPGNKDKLNYLIENLYKLGLDFRLNVVGISKEQYLNNYPEHSIIINRCKKKILFRGKLNHLDTIKYVKSADFSFFIRDDTRLTKAGFPTKFVESISCGTPVITTSTSDLDDYLIEDKNGYFINFGNENSVHKKMNMILHLNREDIYKMKNNCINSRRFNYENYIEEFTNFMKAEMNYEYI